jgi:hypothetical protein
VEDSYQGKKYMGFSCAACHTTQINYQGTGIRIDGAPTLADFEGFFEGIEKAIRATLDDAAKFDRLAKLMVEKEVAKNSEDFRIMLEELYRKHIILAMHPGRVANWCIMAMGGLMPLVGFTIASWSI